MQLTHRLITTIARRGTGAVAIADAGAVALDAIDAETRRIAGQR
jgi:hypothetical protein